MFVKYILIILLSFILVGCKNNNTANKTPYPLSDYNRINNTSDYPLSNNIQNSNENNIASSENMHK